MVKLLLAAILVVCFSGTISGSQFQKPPVKVNKPDKAAEKLYEEFMKKDREATKLCYKENGVSQKDIDKLDKKIEKWDKKILCYGKCMFKQHGYILDGGKLNFDKMFTDPAEAASAEDKAKYRKCLENKKLITCEDFIEIEKCRSGSG